MAKRGQQSFMKRQKEIKRKQKAQEKMERRQGKNKEKHSRDIPDAAEQSEEEVQE